MERALPVVKVSWGGKIEEEGFTQSARDKRRQVFGQKLN